MAEVKHILVVDDHFEMLEFLRSILELYNQDYQVVSVPSGEEGWLEMLRTPFDLLITDIRLPGMSGFDLVRQAHKVRPGMPVIIITAYSTDQGQEEAQSLGVMHYFKKPIVDTERLLAAVHRSLHGDSAPLPARRRPGTGPLAARPAGGDDALSPSSQAYAMAGQRLRTLLADTGALLVALANSEGQLLFTTGRVPDVRLEHLATLLTRDLANSNAVAEALSVGSPTTIQYHAGAAVDLYSANVGPRHFVMVLFRSQSRRGRIGTVWVFVQRAVRDLAGILAPEAENTSPRPPGSTRPLPPPPPTPETVQASEAPAAAAETLAEPAGATVPAPEDVPESEVQAAEAPESSLSLAEVEAELGLNLAELDGSAAFDLDEFWDDAVNSAEDELQASMRGMSIEEARDKGLLPEDFQAEGE